MINQREGGEEDEDTVNCSSSAVGTPVSAVLYVEEKKEIPKFRWKDGMLIRSSVISDASRFLQFLSNADR